MITVTLVRPYDHISLVEMREWCSAHCAKDFRPGKSYTGGFYGDQMDFYESSEIPWLFESDEDATMFRLRWL